MIRKLMASCAVVALMSGGAISYAQAQTETTAPAIAQETAPAAQDTTAGPAEVAASEEALTPDEPTLATAFIGRSVYSSEDPESDNLGDVNDLIVDDDGKITHAIVGVGGFLGIGEKDVAVPFDELQVVEKDGDIRLIYSATREQLEAAEQFDRTAYDPSARFNEEQAAQADVQNATAPADGTSIAPAAGIATADTAATGVDQQANPAGVVDAQTFVQMAAASNRFEIDSSNLALQQAQNEDIRNFAQRMVDDHTKAGEDLKATVQEANADIPVTDQLDPDHQARLEQLQSASGAVFDREYVEMQIAAHDQAVQLFSSYAEGGDNEALKNFAANTLPVLHEHHQMIQEIGTSQMSATEGSASADQVAAADTSNSGVVTTEATANNQVAGAPGSWGEDSFRTFSPDQVRASTMIGAQVRGPDNADIGQVSDLVLQQDGKSRAALIDVGGFLGMGEKTVAIPFSDIQVQAETDNPNNLVLSVAMTKEQLEQLPTWEPTDRMAGVAPMTDEPKTGEMAAGDPNAPAATDDQMAAAPEAGIDPAAPVTIEEPAVTGSLGPMDYTRATQDLSASQLLGTTVYGPNDESIGEIGDVVFDTQGTIDAVVLDVGGFLGMGEKPVAVGFDRLNVRTDDSGALWVMIDAPQEQLEQAPSYDTTATVQ